MFTLNVNVDRLKYKGWKNHNICTNYKNVVIAVLVSGRLKSKTKGITKDKKGHVIKKTQQT